MNNTTLLRDVTSSPLPAPSWWLMMMEGRAVLDAAQLAPLLPLLLAAPRGDRHPVLVFPGFLASSRSTLIIRHYLAYLGYAAHRWKLGRNYGFQNRLETAMKARVKELAVRYGARVSLIGWSLGGMYARELARDLPDYTRLVISMGSPFGGKGEGTSVGWLYRLLNGPLDEQQVRRFVTPPPVPTTALYSRTDGVVAWPASVETIDHPQVENIEVGGAHCGMGFNPRALLAIADRLAQPEGKWAPFAPRGILRALFGTIENIDKPDARSPHLRLTASRLRRLLLRLEGQFPPS